MCFCSIFFFKQKTAYEMRISDWSSDVCSSDLIDDRQDQEGARIVDHAVALVIADAIAARCLLHAIAVRNRHRLDRMTVADRHGATTIEHRLACVDNATVGAAVMPGLRLGMTESGSASGRERVGEYV